MPPGFLNFQEKPEIRTAMSKSLVFKLVKKIFLNETWLFATSGVDHKC